MAETVETTVTSDEWAQVNSSDLTYALLQLKTGGPILVQVGSVEPSPSSLDGIIMMRGSLEELPMSGLTTGDVIWVRSMDTGEQNLVASYQVVDGNTFTGGE